MNRTRTITPGVMIAGAAATVAALLATTATVVVTSPSARAAQQPGTAATAAADPLVPALRLDKTPASEVAARIRKATGALVVTDRTVAVAPVTLELAPGSLSTALGRIAAVLPEGTVVKIMMLPAPAAPGAAPDGDRVAALIAAQEDLYKPILPLAAPAPQNAATSSRNRPRPNSMPAPAATAPLAPGEVEILGRRLASEQAAPVVGALGLRPVYLITNPKAADDPIQKMSAGQMEALRMWMSMTPEQQGIAADQQIDQLINMDPALRQQLFGQQMKVAEKMMSKIQGLPEGQRQQFWRDLTGGRFDGTRPVPGAVGGSPNKP